MMPNFEMMQDIKCAIKDSFLKELLYFFAFFFLNIEIKTGGE